MSIYKIDVSKHHCYQIKRYHLKINCRRKKSIKFGNLSLMSDVCDIVTNLKVAGW